jgi:hypothetical protein
MIEMSMINAIDKAVSAHGAWKVRLRMAIMHGSSHFDPAVVECDDRCEFGKWLYGSSLSADTRAEMPYQVVRRLHAEFHQCAARVLSSAIGSRQDEAAALMASNFDERSQRLLIALAKWKRELSHAKAA